MSTTRAAIWIVGLAVPAVLWGCMTAAKNDLLVTTRFIVRHIRRIEADVRPNDPESERQQAKGQSRFRRRYSFPEGDPEEQGRMFEALWNVLRDCDPETTAYGPSARRKLGDGRTLPLRPVLIQGESVSGGPLRVRLDWVQYRGSWYIDGYEVLNRRPVEDLTLDRS